MNKLLEYFITQLKANAKFKINGKEYSSLNEIPPELIPEKFRKYIVDKDSNNIPDFIEGKAEDKHESKSEPEQKQEPKQIQTPSPQRGQHRAPRKGANEINNFTIFKVLIILALIGGLVYYFVNNFS